MEKITVIGSSIINHNARHKLNLSVNEYVLLQFAADHYSDNMVYSEHSCMAILGLSKDVVDYGISSLVAKNLLSKQSNNPVLKPYDEWYKAHKEKGFEFGMYYQPVCIGADVVSWRNSSKEAAKRKIKDALKECPIEQLIYAKLRYFFSKHESRSLDFIMGAEVFIGQDKRWKTEWKLKPATFTEFYNYCRQYYWKGNQLDLSGMFPESIKEQQEFDQPLKMNFND